MKLYVAWLSYAVMACSLVGCNVLTDSSQTLSSLPQDIAQALSPSGKVNGRKANGQPVVANPPATTIRFDGREVVLGTAEKPSLTPEQLNEQLIALLLHGKRYSASRLVAVNMPVAEQLLWELAGQSQAREQTELIASVLSVGMDPAVSWNGMLAQATNLPAAAAIYYSKRNQFARKLQAEEPSEAECEQLRLAAQGLKHPLVMIDALHLYAVRELVAGRHAWAESLLLQAIDLAERNRDNGRAADMCLMATVTAQATGELKKSQNAWLKAIEYQVAFQATSDGRFDIAFWKRANELRPTGTPWPQVVSQSLAEHAKFVGCKLTSHTPPELVVHCVFGTSDYMAGNPQLALIHFKQAEGVARPDDVLWLRIAQGKCLAALGQTQAAAALLSSPAVGSQEVAAAAALAALGSAKLQSGAYQQGAQLLHKALSESANLNWSTRSSAEADLALATLIIGDTDEGLKKLQAVRRKFAAEGDIDAQLHTLKNEIEILELEGRDADVARVKQEILMLERKPLG